MWQVLMADLLVWESRGENVASSNRNRHSSSPRGYNVTRFETPRQPIDTISSASKPYRANRLLKSSRLSLSRCQSRDVSLIFIANQKNSGGHDEVLSRYSESGRDP